MATKDDDNDGLLAENEDAPPTNAALFWEVLALAVPTALGNALEYLPVTFALIIIGQIDDKDSETGGMALSAVTLARSFFNATAMAPSFGLMSALRALCPQAVGAGRPELCALYIQRACVLILLAAPPLCAAQVR